ncbi:MAG: C25 family cysteine peptidase, partial [Candidatus Krumholzibacteria bacterium]
MVRKLASIPAGVGLFLAGLAPLLFSPHVSLASDLTYTVRLNKKQVLIERADGSSTVSVEQKGYDRLADPGMPALPYRVFSILLGQGQEVQSYDFIAGNTIQLHKSAEFELAGASVAEDGTIGEGVHMAQRGETYPQAWGRYIGTGYLHGRAIASFAVFPLRVSGEALLLAEDVRVEVTTRAGPMDHVVVRERYRENFEEKLRAELADLVVNPEMNDTYVFQQVRVPKQKGGFQPTTFPSLEGSAVDYLIITRESLVSDFQRLADWKTAKGVPTVIRTVEWIEANTKNGVDLQETIRFFVREAYAKWGITYVLLGGDTDAVPARFAISRFYLQGTEVPVDMYYGGLDGSWNDDHDDLWGEGFNLVPVDSPDLYVEVYNGRMPVSDSPAINVLIDKIISYESAANIDYLDRFMFLAEVLFPLKWPNPPVITTNGADYVELLLANSMAGHSMDVVKMYET